MRVTHLHEVRKKESDTLILLVSGVECHSFHIFAGGQVHVEWCNSTSEMLFSITRQLIAYEHLQIVTSPMRDFNSAI